MGYNTNEILAAMPSTLDLAAAANTDLGTTCDIVSDAMSGFKMQASETGHFADILAAASTKSNTNVELMGETFKYVAPLCGTMGYSAEDASLAIGIMANAGIKGSQAGTTLKTAISNMVHPTKQMQGVMDQLGISMTNSDGSSKSLRDVMGQLREKFATLTPAQQASAAATLFGKEAMSGMLAIITASDSEYNGLASSIDNCDGRASEMASTMQNNLNGQLTALKSALEGAGISIGNALLPMIKALVSGIQGLVNWFNNLSPGMQRFIVIAGLIVAAIGPILLILGSLASAIGSIISIAGVLGVSVGALVGIFSGVVAGIAAVIAIGALLITHWDDIKNVASTVWNGIKTVIGNAVKGIISFFTNLPGNIGNFLTSTWNNAKNWATNMGTTALNAGRGFVTNAVNFFRELPGNIWNFLVNTVTRVETWKANMWKQAIDMGKKFVTNAANFLKNLPEKIAYWLAFAVVKAGKWVIDMANKAKEAGTKFVNNAVNFIKNLPTKIGTFLTNTISKVTSWASNMASKARNAGNNFINNVRSAMSSLPSKIGSVLSSAISKVSSFASQMGSKARSAASSFVRNIKSGISSLPSQMYNIGRNIVQGIINGINSLKDSITSKMQSIAQSALNGAKHALGINSPSKVFKEQVGKWIPLGIADGIESNTEQLYRTMTNLSKNLVTEIPTDKLLNGYEMNINSNKSDKENSSNTSPTNIDSLLHIDNVVINDDKDVEQLANDLAFYLKRKGYAF
nr:MAG TPA: minor tail protein [Caudoviricetes sp.]